MIKSISQSVSDWSMYYDGGEKMFNAVKTMEELKATFEIALANKRGVIVLVKLPGLEAPEEIRNPYSNVRAKLDYYTKTYSSDLKMRTNEAIKIVDCYID